MGTTYGDAVTALYRAPLDQFVAERKRFGAELKASGDKAGAARFVKLGRPTIAAWAVNQLYWQARETFDELLGAGERLRGGDLGAAGARRDAIAKLRARAATLLGDAGHAVTEATLRRVLMNLSALSAAGGFEPDAPGALSTDREPPGFDIGGMALSEPSPEMPPEKAPAPPPVAPKLDKKAEEARAIEQRREREEQRRRDEEERRRLAEEERVRTEERAKKQLERRRLEAALHVAKSECDTRSRQIDELRKELAAAERMLETTRSAVADVQARLTALDASP